MYTKRTLNKRHRTKQFFYKNAHNLCILLCGVRSSIKNKIEI